MAFALMPSMVEKDPFSTFRSAFKDSMKLFALLRINRLGSGNWQAKGRQIEISPNSEPI
jgi:hypothetical protein